MLPTLSIHALDFIAPVNYQERKIELKEIARAQRLARKELEIERKKWQVKKER